MFILTSCILGVLSDWCPDDGLIGLNMLAEFILNKNQIVHLFE